MPKVLSKYNWGSKVSISNWKKSNENWTTEIFIGVNYIVYLSLMHFHPKSKVDAFLMGGNFCEMTLPVELTFQVRAIPLNPQTYEKPMM